MLLNGNSEIKIKECNTFFSRLKGMMFLKRKIDYGYLFKRCTSIHTFFMFQNIDVYMLDKDFNILYSYINLKPWRIILPKKHVYYVIEFSTGLYDLKGKITIL